LVRTVEFGSHVVMVSSGNHATSSFRNPWPEFMQGVKLRNRTRGNEYYVGVSAGRRIGRLRKSYTTADMCHSPGTPLSV